MASYGDYLKALRHTAENVAMKEIVHLENKKKSLQEELKKQKQRNKALS